MEADSGMEALGEDTDGESELLLVKPNSAANDPIGESVPEAKITLWHCSFRGAKRI